ncbi:MAG: beta-ketoacyl-[acyl-carrier-protein] synthase family protein [Spirochaetales bacterium]|nr:beta-ketoacyl-[acyl-carrier-protein] synthase family protein [Spirochaetales bacterium]
MKKTVISGFGILCNAGINKDEVADNILNTYSRINKITKLDVDKCDVKYAGEVDDSRISCITSNEKKLIDRCTTYILIALEEALRDSNINLKEFPPERIGIILGTSLAGIDLAQKFYKQYKKSSKVIKLRYLLQYPIYTCADVISKMYGTRGPKIIISTACSSSATAIGYASDLIKSGIIDIAITGGADSLNELSYAGFYSLNNMSKEQCSPFSDNSIGLSLGEGAGIFVVTDLENALDKKYKIFAEIKGYGIGADAYHPTAPEPLGSGAVFAMKKAIETAHLENASDIQYVNAHGTGTTHNDAIETRTIKKVFGESVLKKIYVSSTKSITGHTLGGAGAIECAISCLGIEKEFIPPTINFTKSRAGCDLNYVPNTPLKNHSITNFLSNSFAFGGNNVSLLVGKPDNDNGIEKETSEPIVITGMGYVSSLGNSIKDIFQALCENKSGISEEETFINGYCRYRTNKTARIKDFNLDVIYRFRDTRKMDRISKLAVGASYLAVKDSGIKITPRNAGEIGLVCGTGTGPTNTLVDFYDYIVEKGLDSGKSSLFTNTVVNAAAGYVGIGTGIKGYTTTVANGIASGLLSIIMGCQFLLRGYCTQVFAGSVDEFSLPLYKGLIGLGVISKDRNDGQSAMPMGLDRDGFILGEGAGFFCLEKKSTALSRGAEIYGEISGYGMSSDVCEISANDPEGKGMELAIESALKQGCVDNKSIDVVFASASGHKLRDKSEGVGIRKALGNIPVFTPANYLGEMMGSVGIISTGIGLMAFQENIVPAINSPYKVDPEIGVNLIMENNLNKKINSFCVTANSFGGNNAAVIIKRSVQQQLNHNCNFQQGGLTE